MRASQLRRIYGLSFKSGCKGTTFFPYMQIKVPFFCFWLQIAGILLRDRIQTGCADRVQTDTHAPAGCI